MVAHKVSDQVGKCVGSAHQGVLVLLPERHADVLQFRLAEVARGGLGNFL